MRIISAHYLWDKETSFVKNPVIQIDENHCINEIKSLGYCYAERAHTEFFGGLLIPSFLGVVGGVKDQHLLNSLYSSGSLYVTCFEDNIVENNISERPKLLAVKSEVFENVNPWSNLVYEVKAELEDDIEILLNRWMSDVWMKYQRKFPAGLFKKEYKSGVLLINGIDWEKMKFTKDLNLRIIDFPY